LKEEDSEQEERMIRLSEPELFAMAEKHRDSDTVISAIFTSHPVFFVILVLFLLLLLLFFSNEIGTTTERLVNSQSRTSLKTGKIFLAAGSLSLSRLLALANNLSKKRTLFF